MRTVLGLAAAIGTWAPGTAAAAPEADLWPRWTRHDPASAFVIEHAAWDRFLGRYLTEGEDGIARLAYGRVTFADKAALDIYVFGLTTVPVFRLQRSEQLAYWINLYNALTAKVVIEHYPVKSIREIGISPGLFTVGPWQRKLLTIEGESLSLNDIEHRILRPIWKDARIHYAVNCAALGCPNLQRVAFTAANADALLERGARDFVNHPRGARFEGERLVVSSIYEWFKEDFGATDAGVIDHLKRFAEPALKHRLESASRIADDAYDWRLNGAD